MKKHISIISLAALTLFSCGGGNQNQNAGTTGAETTAGSDGANTAATPESDDNLNDLQKIWQQIEFDHKEIFAPELENVDYIDLHWYGNTLYDGAIHLLKSGESYKVLLDLHSYPENGDAPMTDPAFSFFIKMFDYKNGKLTPIPMPEELKPYETRWKAEFKNDTLSLSNYYTHGKAAFVWDGTKFVEQQELFAYEILKQIVTDQKEFDRICNDFETNGMYGYADSPLKREDWGTLRWLRFTYHEDDMYPEEGYLDCFPINSGGYFALFRTMSCGDYEHWTYTPYIYKDGRLSDGKSMMPVPGINDYYSNADKFPKDAAEVLSAAMEAPDYTLESNDDNITLYVSFNPWELDERGGVLPAPLKGFQRKENMGFPGLSYHWTGDGFSTSDKPYKEDLQYFEVVPAEWKSAVAYQAAQKLGLNFPNQELENPNHFRMWEDVFDPPSFSVMCFPYSAGGHLVLYGKGSSSLQDYKSYIFKDGEIKETDFKFPVCPLSELLDDAKRQGLDDEIKQLEQIYADKPSLLVEYNIYADRQEIEPHYSLSWDTGLPDATRHKLFSIGKYQNLPKYKWDGEKFVRE